MTTDSRFTRRRLLQLGGGAAVAGLAGCVGSSTELQEESTPTETEAGDDDHDEDEPEEDGHDEEEDGHDDEEDGHDEAIGAPVDAAEVEMTSTSSGNHFEPHVVRVNVGGTVTFHNESGSHTATAYHPDYDQPQLVPDGAAAFDSGLLTQEGATFEHTFETEGVYHYYCVPHETTGMIGSLIVGEPDAHEQPALEEPPEDKPERVREKIAELNEMCNEALGNEH